MSTYAPGRYLGEITGHGFDVLGPNKTPALRIKFKVVAKQENGEYAETDLQYEREVMCWFSENGAKHAIRNLQRYCGWEGDDIGDLNGDCLVGSQVEVVSTEDGEYDRFEFPFEGGGGKDLVKNEKVAKHLRNKYNRLVKDLKPKTEKPKTEKPKKETVPPSDGNDDEDDIPF